MWVTLLVSAVLLVIVNGVPLNPKADTVYRLPSDLVKVNNYNIKLVVTNETFLETHKFQGTTIIDFTILNSTKEIQIHGNKIVASKVTLQIKTAEEITLDQTSWVFNDVTDILTLTTQVDLQPETDYLLTFEYEAEFKTDQMYGFYKSTYTDTDGTEKVLGSTQFQPTHARKVFPCFDEPSYKATFDIQITHPLHYEALGNMQGTTVESGAAKTTTFATTPIMPTYLIAFVVSDFTCTESESKIDTDIPHLVCSRETTSDLRNVALQVGPRIVEQMEIFTGVEYKIAEIPKMHQVAIPDFSAGAMENWGLITYREAYLLWDETQSSNRYKQYVETIIAHEIAHMWFGNLVTTHWWSDTFLNEGFANFFEYFITAKVEPTWELDKQYVVDQIHPALRADAQPTSAPLSYSVNSPSQVSGRFNTISYNKGGTIFRMVEHFLGEEYFKTAITTYLNNNKFENTVPGDLWDALNPPENTFPTGSSLSHIMNNWINKPGYPVLSVVSNDSNIILSQKRFLLSGNDTDSTKWYIPITYATDLDPNFDNPEVKDWLIPLADIRTIRNVINGTKWIVLNVLQKGYYRVDYDDILWSRIEDALKANHTDIHEINRAQLIDDLYSFAQVDVHPFQKVLDFYKYLENEISYLPWYAALNAFSQMLQKTSDDRIIREISSFIVSLIDTAYKALPFDTANDNNHIYTLNRVLINNWACRSGHSDCVNKSLEAFAAYKSNSDLNKPDKNLRSIIYCNGLRHSTDAENDWNFLWDEYIKSDLAAEKVTILSALGCATDENVLIGYLNKSIDAASGIKQQDALSAFSAVYTQNPGGVDIGLSFLIANHQAIENYYGSLNSVSSLISGLAARFTQQSQIDKLEEFISNTENLSESLISAAQSALTNARSNLEWTKQFEDQMITYFNIDNDNGGGNTADMVRAGFTMTVTIFLFCYYTLF